MPLVRDDEAVGVITLESERAHTFSQEDAEFLIQLANQTVISIDNALLFRRITEARDRLQAILDTMREGLILIDNRSACSCARWPT